MTISTSVLPYRVTDLEMGYRNSCFFMGTRLPRARFWNHGSLNPCIFIQYRPADPPRNTMSSLLTLAARRKCTPEYAVLTSAGPESAAFDPSSARHFAKIPAPTSF